MAYKAQKMSWYYITGHNDKLSQTFVRAAEKLCDDFTKTDDECRAIWNILYNMAPTVPEEWTYRLKLMRELLLL